MQTNKTIRVNAAYPKGILKTCHFILEALEKIILDYHYLSIYND